ncbi:MAG: ATP synthase F0 subunit C [bacterium]
MNLPVFLHYFSAALAMMLGVVGGGLAQGIAGLSTLEAMERQPTGGDSLFKSLIIGLALIESGLIIALVMSLMVLFSVQEPTMASALCELGMGLAIGTAAASISIASSFVVRAATFAISRQPFFAQKIITIMLLTQSIIEAPVIFAFIVSLLIKMNISPSMTVYESLRYFAAALAVALGSIGPSIGQGIFANAACSSIGLNKRAYEKVFPFTLVTQAVIETPMIFSMLVSLLIIYSHIILLDFSQGIILITAAATIGFGALGSAAGIGFAASKSCYQIASEPANYGPIFRATLLVLAFIESMVIYALIIAMLLIKQAS